VIRGQAVTAGNLVDTNQNTKRACAVQKKVSGEGGRGQKDKGSSEEAAGTLTERWLVFEMGRRKKERKVPKNRFQSRSRSLEGGGAYCISGKEESVLGRTFEELIEGFVEEKTRVFKKSRSWRLWHAGVQGGINFKNEEGGSRIAYALEKGMSDPKKKKKNQPTPKKKTHKNNKQHRTGLGATKSENKKKKKKTNLGKRLCKSVKRRGSDFTGNPKKTEPRSNGGNHASWSQESWVRKKRTVETDKGLSCYQKKEGLKKVKKQCTLHRKRDVFWKREGRGSTSEKTTNKPVI